jgi:tRNA-splicing ligase RtcB
MPQVWKHSNGAPIKAWIDGVELETEAMEQLDNVSRMPFIHKHIAVMPDVHTGLGATIGSVIPARGAIMPAAVGVDLGCGMRSVKTNWKAEDLPKDLSNIRSAIEVAVPHGRSNHGGDGDVGGWNDIPDLVLSTYSGVCEPRDLAHLQEKYPELKRANTAKHLGTLGTGNHFIEICLDEEDSVWVMLHSGSRGIGNKLGSFFIKLAKKEMEKWFIELPDKNLAYFPEGTEYFNDYMKAVNWAQHFAKTNRWVMMENTIDVMEDIIGSAYRGLKFIDCHHNYVAIENHFGRNIYVTRKGATRARKGDWGIIPGSMGAKSYIVRGLGNPESFHSCSHGAGRRMSRTKARNKFSLEEHSKATAGVECRKDADVLDETPGAYKSIDAVMEAQKDLVEVVHTLKQVVCVKG